MSLAEVQGRLAPGEVLVHHDVLDEHKLLVLLAVRREGAWIEVRPRGDLEALAERYRRLLASGQDDEARAVGNGLYEVLLDPVAAALDGARALRLCPRGALHSIAWSALHDGQRHLVERFEVSLAPSFTGLAAVRSRAPERRLDRPPLALVVGATHFDPEAERRRVGGDGGVRVEITAAGFLAGASADVLYVKAHGVYDAADTAASHLLLVPSGASDGRLRLDELARADLDVDTVILQSCEAARTEAAPGDQMDSFARAFLAAGAQAVIAPLWEVPQEVADAVAGPLAKALAEPGATPQGALRQVQLSLLAGEAGPEAARPSAWGIFTVTGAGSEEIPER
jgi:CHAT domain-containing protein